MFSRHRANNKSDLENQLYYLLSNEQALIINATGRAFLYPRE